MANEKDQAAEDAEALLPCPYIRCTQMLFFQHISICPGKYRPAVADALRKRDEKLKDAAELIELAAIHCERPADLFPEMSIFDRLTTGYDEMVNERREQVLQIFNLESQLAAAKGGLVCDICGGDLEHAAKINCACKGTGNVWKAFQTAREELFKLRAELAALKEERKDIADAALAALKRRWGDDNI